MNQQDQGDYCPKCGAFMEWVSCWNGCDDGEIDCYEEDPLWYTGPWRYQRCEVCQGEGGWLVCTACYPETVTA